MIGEMTGVITTEETAEMIEEAEAAPEVVAEEIEAEAVETGVEEQEGKLGGYDPPEADTSCRNEICC